MSINKQITHSITVNLALVGGAELGSNNISLVLLTSSIGETRVVAVILHGFTGGVSNEIVHITSLYALQSDTSYTGSGDTTTLEMTTVYVRQDRENIYHQPEPQRQGKEGQSRSLLLMEQKGW